VFNFYSSHKTWIDYLPASISVVLSFISLVFSGMALYFTRFKKGKPEIHLYMSPKEYTEAVGGRYCNTPVHFLIGIPVLIRNIGANAIALGEIKCKLEHKGVIRGEIYRQLEISDPTGLCPLSPYQQIVKSLGIKLEIDGYGEGFQYQDKIPDIKSHLKESNVTFVLRYKSYEKKQIKHYNFNYDLMPIIKNIMLEQPRD